MEKDQRGQVHGVGVLCQQCESLCGVSPYTEAELLALCIGKTAIDEIKEDAKSFQDTLRRKAEDQAPDFDQEDAWETIYQDVELVEEAYFLEDAKFQESSCKASSDDAEASDRILPVNPIHALPLPQLSPISDARSMTSSRHALSS